MKRSGSMCDSLHFVKGATSSCALSLSKGALSLSKGAERP
jgi:hypothetical protein